MSPLRTASPGTEELHESLGTLERLTEHSPEG